jgi:hypothetical protein
MHPQKAYEREALTSRRPFRCETRMETLLDAGIDGQPPAHPKAISYQKFTESTGGQLE